VEFHEDANVSLYLSDLSAVCEFDSMRQRVGLYEHPLLGKVLILNGEIHHIESYQHLYHEPLVHLPLAFLEEPRSCLIIGGGSLFAAFEVLKYPTIEKVVLCDFDHTVLDLMFHTYEHAKKVKTDNRFHYIEEDAISFIDSLNDKFDLVINDCFNLAEISTSVSMYDKLNSLCTPYGICADVIYRHIFDRVTTQESLRLINSKMNLALSLTVIPEYPGILHILTIWGKNPNISQTQTKTINLFQLDKSNKHNFKVFVPDHIPYYLYLPPYIKGMLL
jgi:spermidine synthase